MVKIMKKIIKQNDGFTLPELMLAVAILGGLSVVTMKLVSEQEGNRAYMFAKSEIAMARSLVSLTLADKENCRSIMAGKKYPAVNPAVADRESLTSLTIPLKTSPGAFKEILRANTMYSGFRTREIYIDRPSGLAPDVVMLVVRFLIRSKNLESWGAASTVNASDRIIEEKFPINITKNASNIITDCGMVVSATNDTTRQQFCESLGDAAQWNSTTKKCTFKDMTCPEGQVMVKVENLGTITCKTIDTQMNLDDLVDSTPCTVGSTKQFSLVSTPTGKIKVDCSGADPDLLNCNAPWGDVVMNGTSVTACQYMSCTGFSEETRTCTNGTLSGTYSNKLCPLPNPACLP